MPDDKPLAWSLTLEEERALEHLRVAARQLGLPPCVADHWAGGCLYAAEVMLLRWRTKDADDEPSSTPARRPS